MMLLGKIVRLQVQTASLKVGTGAKQRYDRSPVRVLERLELDDGGVWGNDGQERVADVHHRDHPQSKLVGTRNSISFGFTGHYDAMRERFGEHMANGVASESILIEYDGLVGADDVANGIVITTQNGENISLAAVSVAAPCAPFSRWSLQFPEAARPDRTVTEALQFLSDGMRGYYCKYEGAPQQIALGDSVFALD